MKKQDLIEMGDTLAKSIRNDRQETTRFVNEVQIFLISLPDDLVLESLNTARKALLRKCEIYYLEKLR